MGLQFVLEQSQEEGKGQESSTTPDPGHGKEQENIIYKGAKRSALSQKVTTRLQETDMADKTY